MSNNEIANMLIIVLCLMFVVLVILVFAFLVIKAKSNKAKNQQNDMSGGNGKNQIQSTYNIQSIFNFMEFDKIEDNMIVQKKGKRFVMVIKCQGINYDLMSGVEKNSVEQGFIQYLNTLRYPIQIYIQTRTVDLTGSLSTYKQKVKDLGNSLAQKEFNYDQKVRAGGYTRLELEKEQFEIVKARNLYEYGMDIVSNTERMSLNKNILSKQYYVILSYYPEEANESNYSADEIRNIAFSELYTRAQSTINLLAVSGVNGKVLDSMDLADLLYTAYNRDESELYDLKKAINAGYDNMYVTAPDVLDKRMRELDKQIESDAISLANDSVYKVKLDIEKERKIKQKEKDMKDIIARMAVEILEDNNDILGNEVTDRAIKEITEEDNKKEDSEGEETNEQKKTKKSGRPRRTA